MTDWRNVFENISDEVRKGMGSRNGRYELSFSADHLDWLNERHLHHRFTSYLSSKEKIQVVGVPSTGEFLLFPEYPTSKANVTHGDGIWYWKAHPESGLPAFRNEAPPKGGQPVGHPDFVIGRLGTKYFEPDIAMEFKLGSWFKEEVAFDYLKLVDPRMNYHAGISICVITGLKGSRSIPPTFRAKNGTSSAIDIFEQSIEKHGGDIGAPTGRLCRFFVFDWLEGGEIGMWEFEHKFMGREWDPFFKKLRSEQEWKYKKWPGI